MSENSGMSIEQQDASLQNISQLVDEDKYNYIFQVLTNNPQLRYLLEKNNGELIYEFLTTIEKGFKELENKTMIINQHEEYNNRLVEEYKQHLYNIEQSM